MEVTDEVTDEVTETVTDEVTETVTDEVAASGERNRRVQLECKKFLERYKPTTGGRLSHTLFTGGMYFVPESRQDELWQELAKAFRKGSMPAIQEVHTVKFPMYLDLDMETPMPHISKEAVRKMAYVMNVQLQKFFPKLGDITLLICTKVRGGVAVKGGLYKQGFHFHWPSIVVVVETALSIRQGIIIGLQGTGSDSDTDWKALIGLSDPDWDKIVDKQVYRSNEGTERYGGLRLVGAPKAKVHVMSKVDGAPEAAWGRSEPPLRSGALVRRLF